MSRYTGPRMRKMRSLGCLLPGLSAKSEPWDRRPYPPGQHGQGQRRRKESDYKLQLVEKQKLRFNYGVSEKQLRRLYAEAMRSKANTGLELLAYLESRFDNVVFRAGFSRSIPAARQLINHGHLLLNGKKADIASIRIKAGDEISFRERSSKLDIVTEALERIALQRPAWLECDDESRTVKVVKAPDHESVPFDIEVQRVIEYYSQ
ncbi:MAG: 30S ribosomal protein S4 [Myxococcota bacterium]